MIPMMMTGKTTGMLVAVTASTHVIPTGTAAVNGPVVGVVVLGRHLCRQCRDHVERGRVDLVTKRK